MIRPRGMKTDCVWDIKSFRKGYIRLARTLDHILYTTLQRQIRRKSVILLGSDTFGISTIKVKFSIRGKYLWFKNSSTQDNISEPTICKYSWKNTAEKPSGPGDLRGDIWDRVEITSEATNGAVSYWFIAGVTTLSKISSIRFGAGLVV